MPRAGLDQATVVAAGAAVADEHGLENMTLALVAASLGIRSPSLYNHVAGLEGLKRDLALLGARELSRRLARAAAGRTQGDAVLALAGAMRAFAHEHSGVYAASVRAPDRRDRELSEAGREVIDIVLSVLSSFGLQGDDALHATRGLRAIVHGFVTLEASGGFGLPLDLDESFARLVAAFVEGLGRQGHSAPSYRA